jgi:hypothetical protein
MVVRGRDDGCRRSVGERGPEGYRERPREAGREARCFGTSRPLSLASARRARHGIQEVEGSTPLRLPFGLTHTYLALAQLSYGRPRPLTPALKIRREATSVSTAAAMAVTARSTRERVM